MRAILQGGGASDSLKYLDITLTANSSGTYEMGITSQTLSNVGVSNPFAMEIISAVASNVSTNMNNYPDNNYVSLSATELTYAFQPRVNSATTGTVVVRIYYWEKPTGVLTGTVSIKKTMTTTSYTLGA